MPPIRTVLHLDKEAFPYRVIDRTSSASNEHADSNKSEADDHKLSPPQQTSIVPATNLSNDMIYPVTPSSRQVFKTKAGKRVTPHQWAVYDFTMRIPRGRVMTYGDLCRALGEGSPRSVGTALRNNPFAPYVPCHRVIAANLFIGGFCGQWGLQTSTDNKQPQARRKMDMLAKEGVKFSGDGYLIDAKNVLWKG